MRALVVGGGPTTRELIQGLGERWQVVLVETDPDALQRTAAVRSVTEVLTDDLEGAVSERVADADALVAGTNDDSVNLRICRIGQAAGLQTIAAVAADPERLGLYREAGVAAVSPDRLTARRFEISLEPRRVSSAAFADGMAEVLEFRIAADSPLRGKALGELGSEPWLVVSILRRERLIIPHGASVLQEGDVVTVTGAVADYAEILATFTAGVATFPRDYGTWVAVIIGEDPPGVDSERLAEAAYVARTTSADGLLLAGAGLAAAETSWRATAEELAGDVDVHVLATGSASLAAAVEAGAGLAIVSAPTGRLWRVRRDLARLLRAAAAVPVPVLVSRGTYPYGRVMMAAEEGPATAATIRAAVDLAARCGADLNGVAAVPPPFMARPEAGERMAATMARLREEAAIQGVTVHGQFEEGNPVRVVERSVGAGNVLVVGMPARLPSWLNPGPVVHLARRASASVLVVPVPP